MAATHRIAALLSICALLPFTVHAETALRITEIMYNAEGADTGKEYVRISNTGSEDIDTSGLVLSEHGRERRIQSKGITLSPGDNAVIVGSPDKFAEHYTYSGTVLDSTNYALNNTGSTLILILNGENLHTITYSKEDGGNGDGTALHVARDNTLSSGSPLSGTGRQRAPRETTTPTRETTAPSQTTSPTRETTAPSKTKAPAPKPKSEPKKEPKPEFTTQPDRIFTASETSFTVLFKDKPVYGTWNFGDSRSTSGDTVTHTYPNAGTYIITFREEPRNKRWKIKEKKRITLRKEVTVITPQVRAERVDDEFVRISNGHTFILDISGWRFTAGDSTLTFPDESFIPAEKSITTSFSVPAGVPISFTTKGGGTFRGSIVPRRPVQKSAPAETPAPPQPVEPAVSQETPEEPTPQTSRTIIIWIVLLIGLLAIAVAPIFLNRKKEEQK